MSSESPINTSNSRPPPIDTLLQLLPTHTTDPSVTPSILSILTAHPDLAHAADSSGYTLAHAAASYKALAILRALATGPYANANDNEPTSNQKRKEWMSTVMNKPDLDGDTPLFYAETLPAAKLLVEELGAEWRPGKLRNSERKSVEENAEENAEELATNTEEARGWREVADYLRGLRQRQDPNVRQGTADSVEEPLRHPPPLPPGVTVNLMNNPSDGPAAHGQPSQTTGEIDESSLPPPDPEFRRRIEALAAREGGLETEDGQKELRELVEDAVGGLQGDGGLNEAGEREATRRRVD